MNQILGINESNNLIYFYDIDNSPDKQKQIYDLADDVKKYFKCGTWAYFTKAGQDERQYLSLIRSIYRNMGYDVTPTIKHFFRDDKKIIGKTYALHKSN